MTTPESLARLTPLDALPSMWEIGRARGVSRDALRARLGDPMYVETDASATFGGEEDWWGYRTPQGTAVAVCLRVPYCDAMLCASDPSSSSDWEHLHVIVEPWPVETFDLPRC